MPLGPGSAGEGAVTEIERLLTEAEEHLGDEPVAGEDMAALQSRLLRAQHAVLRAQIAAIREHWSKVRIRFEPPSEEALRKAADALRTFPPLRIEDGRVERGPATPPSGGERSDSQMNLERKITDG